MTQFLSFLWLSNIPLYIESESEVAQSCPTICDPVDCSLPGFSIHGILQARILEWVDGCKSWTIKKAEHRRVDVWTMVLEKTLESPLDSKEIQPVHPKGNQSWIFIGRTDAEAETPILWPPDAKNWLILKNPDAGQDWRQEKRTTEDEMVGWHHRLDGHEFEQIPRVGDRQGSLSCCSPWSHKELDTSERLTWRL